MDRNVHFLSYLQTTIKNVEIISARWFVWLYLIWAGQLAPVKKNCVPVTKALVLNLKLSSNFWNIATYPSQVSIKALSFGYPNKLHLFLKFFHQKLVCHYVPGNSGVVVSTVHNEDTLIDKSV